MFGIRLQVVFLNRKTNSFAHRTEKGYLSAPFFIWFRNSSWMMASWFFSVVQHSTIKLKLAEAWTSRRRQLVYRIVFRNLGENKYEHSGELWKQKENTFQFISGQVLLAVFFRGFKNPRIFFAAFGGEFQKKIRRLRRRIPVSWKFCRLPSAANSWIVIHFFVVQKFLD